MSLWFKLALRERVINLLRNCLPTDWLVSWSIGCSSEWPYPVAECGTGLGFNGVDEFVDELVTNWWVSWFVDRLFQLWTHPVAECRISLGFTALMNWSPTDWLASWSIGCSWSRTPLWFRFNAGDEFHDDLVWRLVGRLIDQQFHNPLKLWLAGITCLGCC